MVRILPLVFLLAVPVMSADEPDPEPVTPSQADLKKLQGTWDLVRAERGGKAKGEPGMRVVITRNQLVIKERKGSDETTTIKLDASKKPPHIDIFPVRGPGEVVKGIYRMAGDELTIVFSHKGKERPARFEDTAGGKLVLRKRKPK